MKKAAVLIPARLESRRLPRKLLLAETGRPVLAHTVERALAAKAASEGAIDRVLVAADDDVLCEVARGAGAEAVLTRTDHRSGTDRIAEAARSMSEELVVNIQGDEPEIEPSHVLAAARLLQGNDDPMGTLAYPVTDEAAFRDPNLVKVVVALEQRPENGVEKDREGHALYFSRAPIPFPREGEVDGAWGLAHMGLYVYRREFLLRYSALPESLLERREKLEQLRALEAGERIRVAVVEPPCAAVGESPRYGGIDTREAYEEFCRRVKSLGAHS